MSRRRLDSALGELGDPSEIGPSDRSLRRNIAATSSSQGVKDWAIRRVASSTLIDHRAERALETIEFSDPLPNVDDVLFRSMTRLDSGSPKDRAMTRASASRRRQ